MTSHLYPTLSALHIHQIHLNLEDGGFSLPNMLFTRQSAYIASFSQCLSSTVDMFNLLHPITLDDILLLLNCLIILSFIFLTLHSLIISNLSLNFRHSIPPWTLILSCPLIAMIPNCSIPYMYFVIHHIFQYSKYHFTLLTIRPYLLTTIHPTPADNARMSGGHGDSSVGPVSLKRLLWSLVGRRCY